MTDSGTFQCFKKYIAMKWRLKALNFLLQIFIYALSVNYICSIVQELVNCAIGCDLGSIMRDCTMHNIKLVGKLDSLIMQTMSHHLWTNLAVLTHG